MEVGESGTAYVNEDYRPLNAAEYLAITREGLVNFGAARLLLMPHLLQGVAIIMLIIIGKMESNKPEHNKIIT